MRGFPFERWHPGRYKTDPYGWMRSRYASDRAWARSFFRFQAALEDAESHWDIQCVLCLQNNAEKPS